MGAEFIRRAAKTFKKSWDKSRVELGTADLFKREASPLVRTAPFDVAQNAALCTGDFVIVETEGAALVARHSLTEVARIKDPPAELFRAVKDSCGIAKGKIEQVHDLAGVAEISLC
jgi:hypothetical protein